MIKNRFQAIVTAAALSFSLGAFSSACDEEDEDDTTCGWDTAWSPSGQYLCGMPYPYEDPIGEYKIDCPDTLVPGAPCEGAGLTYAGCCEAGGAAVWYCGIGSNEGKVIRHECD